MKTIPLVPPIVDAQLVDEDQQALTTLWFADGKSMSARVTKVGSNGIQFTTLGASGFINATDLCTVDRVRYGYGTRQESAWVAKMNANEAKRNSVRGEAKPISV